jgi:hypothetical protein
MEHIFLDRRNDKPLETHINKVKRPKFKPQSWYSTLIILTFLPNKIFGLG